MIQPPHIFLIILLTRSLYGKARTHLAAAFYSSLPLLLPYNAKQMRSISGRRCCHRQSPPMPLSSLSKIPEVADASSIWPTGSKLPDWGCTGWRVPTGKETYEVVPGPGPWHATIKNDRNLVLATVILSEEDHECDDPNDWSAFRTDLVNPASAYLAPRGGCDNLCNDDERYTDFCTFQVDASTSKWLLVCSEHDTWSFLLQSQWFIIGRDYTLETQADFCTMWYKSTLHSSMRQAKRCHVTILHNWMMLILLEPVCTRAKSTQACAFRSCFSKRSRE